MQAEPPQAPTRDVAVPLFPLPQEWSIDNGQVAGMPVLWVTIVSQMSAQVLVLDRDGALAFARALQEKAGGLLITSSLPPTNGNAGGPH